MHIIPLSLTCKAFEVATSDLVYSGMRGSLPFKPAPGSSAFAAGQTSYPAYDLPPKPWLVALKRRALALDIDCLRVSFFKILKR